MSVVEVGLRVVRGPDWSWGAQDGGPGHTGTVVEVGGCNSVTTPDKTVVVVWDSGNKTNYRVGYQNAYDLSVFDSAAAGVRHPQTACAGCKERAIRGMRWRCAVCPDPVDLCTLCYMADRHDTAHAFLRVERPGQPGREVPCRRDSAKIQLKGIFTGAKVVRGVDWEWGDQDANKVGRVTDIHGWDNESGRSVANVSWLTGVSNVYRMGHQGKVDLMLVNGGEAAGGNCYTEHLPALGRPLPAAAAAEAGAAAGAGAAPVRPAPAPPARPAARLFSMGDRVRVAGDAASLQAAQEGHGGWNPRMADFIGQVGVVHRITDRGDIRVQYPNGTRWTINPAALVRVSPLTVGDTVRVLEDASRVKLLQKGHGEWIEMMRMCLGKTGQITKIYADGDLRVSMNGQTWTINPLCVTPVTGAACAASGAAAAGAGPAAAAGGAAAPDNNSLRVREREEQPGTLVSFINSFLEQHKDTSLADRLVRDAAQGRTEAVREWLEKQRDKVDAKSSGRTALQLACHQGHMDTVRLLLHAQASVSATDDDGDTPLHYSAFGNQPEIMELLIRKGADVNATNRGQCSALHVSVNKQHVGCVRVLVKASCNPNLQDMYGDTALHDAIGKDNLEIIELLGNVPALDFKIKNKRGFNVLHHAALKGNNFAVEKLLGRSRQAADMKKEDGFTALHLACLNGHSAVVETLAVLGQCDLDAVNNRRQTPLLLAVSQLHLGIVEYLVSRGASVLLADEDGDTPLHLACLKLAASSEVRPGEAPLIHGIKAHLASQGTEVSLVQALACYLAQEGAPLDHINRKNRTPLDLAVRGSDRKFADLLQWYSKQRSHSLELPSLSDLVKKTMKQASGGASGGEPQSPDAQPNSSVAVGALADHTAKLKLDNDEESCIVCCELPVSVEFEPCGHRITCDHCCVRMKKCLRCQAQIVTKKTTDGKVLSARGKVFSVLGTERLRYLETKIAEIEEVHGCSICMERRRNVVFLCGHGACAVCAHALQNCHMCRKPITQKINIY
ncbi:E3 ubiquitin-protein ligase MIB2-like [Amphibalanus amphitrite]|uniref:E3 ubiquitin-protein ligase MIB2-like n=1 Tax=Amphibalanus amphitrite TaxID=1232801 RepID=UPI001C90501D|nr:E3 ubiquitin-protein ligase MIB2-like [Amphibalanus amphitrite]